MSSIKPKAFPCRCGHSKRLHGWTDAVSGEAWDTWCESAKYCECEQYVPDNLKYLEKIYKRKKNGNK